MNRRSALVLAAFLCAAPSAFADAHEPSPKISEKACHLPHFLGRLETVIDPEVCADGRCGRDFDVILLRPDDSIVYDVKGTFRRGDPPLPSLDCRGGLLVLAWRGQTLRLELDAQHSLRFVASDRRRLDALWSLPVASLESRRKKGTPFSPELAAHLAELQQELAAAPE